MSILAVCPVHVGREAELDQLLKASATNAMTVIAGEAGIGKSRLAREAVELAGQKGQEALVGYCSQDGGTPYGAFVTAIRRHLRSIDPAVMAELFDGAATLAAGLFPELSATLQGPVPTPSSQADLFASIWHLLHRLAGDPHRATMMLLEDLHWADPDTTRLLGYLAREGDGLGVWLVGTYRSDEVVEDHPLSSVLRQLARERRLEQIELRPLSREGLRSMVSAVFDGTVVGDEFLDALTARTGGNPFFTEELLRALLEEGAIYRSSGEWTRLSLDDIKLPQSIRETMLGRIRQLGERPVEILRIAAIVGERIDDRILARATGSDPAEIDEVMAAGIRLQILVERGDGQRFDYSFRHALTRQALVEDLVGPRRRRAHRCVADAMAAIRCDDLDAVAAELAMHYRQAGETDAAIQYGVRAARQAVRSAAVEEVSARYRSVLDLLAITDPRRPELLVEAAEALSRQDPATAEAFATAALGALGNQGSALLRSRALEELSRVKWSGGDSHQSLALAKQAHQLMAGTGDRREIWALARYAHMLALCDRLTEAAELLERALPVAQANGDDKALALMYNTRLSRIPEGDELETAFREATAAARRAGDGATETIQFINRAFVALWNGYLARSREVFAEAIDVAARYLPSDRYCVAGQAWLLSLTGEYAAANAIAEGLLTASPRVDVPTRIVALTALCETGLRSGRSDLSELVEQLCRDAAATGEAQRSVPALAARARLAAQAEGMDASQFFEEALASTINDQGKGSHWPFSPDYARYLFRGGRRDELSEWCDRVTQLTEADPNRHNRAADDFCTGLLRLVDRKLADSISSLVSARRTYAEMPCPAREAECLLALAEAYWQADQAAESSRAAQQASEIAARIGAPGLVEEAEQLQSRASTPTVLATILFTDIVGSTQKLAELGDRAWKTLIERHNEIVRAELARWRGREIDTAGDGFCASFDSPAAGVRCALAVRDALRPLGIEVRAGLHTGECQVSGSKLTGLAVNLAARVGATAGSGEILVSGTVQDLVAGSALRFEERGSRELKGIPGTWRLAAVTTG